MWDGKCTGVECLGLCEQRLHQGRMGVGLIGQKLEEGGDLPDIFFLFGDFLQQGSERGFEECLEGYESVFDGLGL